MKTTAPHLFPLTTITATTTAFNHNNISNITYY